MLDEPKSYLSCDTQAKAQTQYSVRRRAVLISHALRDERSQILGAGVVSDWGRPDDVVFQYEPAIFQLPSQRWTENPSY